jgi:hypothetical protein
MLFLVTFFNVWQQLLNCVLYVTYINHKLPLFLLHVYLNGLILIMLTTNITCIIPLTNFSHIIFVVYMCTYHD